MIRFSEVDVPLIQKISREPSRQAHHKTITQVSEANIELIKKEVDQIKRRILKRQNLSHSHHQWKSIVKPKGLRPLAIETLHYHSDKVNKTRSKTEDSEPVTHFALNNSRNIYTYEREPAQPNSKRVARLDTLVDTPKSRFKGSKSYLFGDVNRGRKRLRLKPVRNNLQAKSEYDAAITHLHESYEAITALLTNLKIQPPEAIRKSLHAYVWIVGKLDSNVLDDFIQENDSDLQRQLRVSRLFEFASILYVSLELVKDSLHEMMADLINVVGHAAANLIFVTKLFILSRKPRQPLLNGSFQKCIARFEEQSYGQILRNPADIAHRIQHNNDTISMLHVKLGKRHPDFETRIKHFMRNYHRQTYPTSQCFRFMFQYLAYYLHAKQLTRRVEFLDAAPHPYLDFPASKPYTIIINPEVLITFRFGKYCVRPYTSQFLQFLASNAQIVFWSKNMPTEVDQRVSMIDLKGHSCEKRLYRYHCDIKLGHMQRDLAKLGRSLNKVVLLDHEETSRMSHPNNGIEITWRGTSKDKKLSQLTQILSELFQKGMSVPEFTSKYFQRLKVLQHHSKPSEPKP